MSDSLRTLALERIARGEAGFIIEVIATRGSVPREAGTRMLVWADDCAGTIGGGHLEWRAIAKARAALRDPAQWPEEEEIALGASLGQCCGGAVSLRYRRLDEAALADWAAHEPASVIQLYGAGHVGRAIAHLLGTLDVCVQWIDERDDAFPNEPPPSSIERVCVEPVEAEVAIAPPGCFYLVLTHQHDLDLRIVEAILRRGDFAWLGLIGSITKRRRFVQQLKQRGMADVSIARITCPIGIDGITGKEPATIAIAAVAQLLQAIEHERAGNVTTAEVARI